MADPLATVLACLVIAIADGDTLTARCGDENVKVRLAEIDAPESSQPFGHRSRQHLAGLCFRKRATVAPKTTDRYGRAVARVICEGVDANAEQVRAGMAWAFLRYLDDRSIVKLEAEARAARKGLWRDAAPMTPWDWRAAKRHSNP